MISVASKVNIIGNGRFGIIVSTILEGWLGLEHDVFSKYYVVYQDLCCPLVPCDNEVYFWLSFG